MKVELTFEKYFQTLLLPPTPTSAPKRATLCLGRICANLGWWMSTLGRKLQQGSR